MRSYLQEAAPASDLGATWGLFKITNDTLDNKGILRMFDRINLEIDVDQYGYRAYVVRGAVQGLSLSYKAIVCSQWLCWVLKDFSKAPKWCILVMPLAQTTNHDCDGPFILRSNTFSARSPYWSYFWVTLVFGEVSYLIFSLSSTAWMEMIPCQVYHMVCTKEVCLRSCSAYRLLKIDPNILIIDNVRAVAARNLSSSVIPF